MPAEETITAWNTALMLTKSRNDASQIQPNPAKSSLSRRPNDHWEPDTKAQQIQLPPYCLSLPSVNAPTNLFDPFDFPAGGVHPGIQMTLAQTQLAADFLQGEAFLTSGL